jgi:predicted CXXCH cytochrome family protein
MRPRVFALLLLLFPLCLGNTLFSQQGTPQEPPAPATAVGAGTCATCHEDIGKQFERSVHGQLAGFELRGQSAACESCHGPGSRHVESGDPAAIRSFNTLPAQQAAQVCLSCHRQDAALDWAGSQHAGVDVTCTSCHGIHQSRRAVEGLGRQPEGMQPVHASAPAAKGSLKQREMDLCVSCHQEKRARMFMSSRHPVREGRMGCSSCHNPHGGVQGVAMLRTGERANELCTSCHAAKAGPFVFEHAPVEENCMTCHDPHGTMANNLLKQNEPFLCLQCHEMHFHNARVAPTSPFYLPAGGSNNPNGRAGFQMAYGTRCSACHSRVHGSDMPSQGVSGGGAALTR